MLRREFFNWLGGLPLCGFLKDKPSEHNFIKGVVTKLEPIKHYRSPKLRVWTLGDKEKNILPTKEAVTKLADILSKWDRQSDLDIVWDDFLRVEQFDLHDGDLDMVLQPGQVKVESVEKDVDGKLIARIVIKEPLVRVVKENND